jgi:hypothetical protein
MNRMRNMMKAVVVVTSLVLGAFSAHADECCKNVEELADAIDNLVMELAEEGLSEEEVARPEVRQSLLLLAEVFTAPLRDMPESARTPENLEWYFDSVRFHLVVDSSLESKLNLGESGLESFKTEIHDLAVETYGYLEQGLTRQKMEEIRASLIDFSSEAAALVIEQFKAADHVYISRKVRVGDHRFDGMSVDEYLTNVATGLMVPTEVVEGLPLPDENPLQEGQRERLKEIILGIWLEQQVLNSAQNASRLADFKLQSLFAVAWYYDDYPVAAEMTEDAKIEINEILDDAMGKDTIVIKFGTLPYVMWSFYDKAVSVVTSEKVGNSYSSNSSYLPTPEEDPDAYIEARFVE